jgi:hypothetical protein
VIVRKGLAHVFQVGIDWWLLRSRAERSSARAAPGDMRGVLSSRDSHRSIVKTPIVGQNERDRGVGVEGGG